MQNQDQDLEVQQPQTKDPVTQSEKPVRVTGSEPLASSIPVNTLPSQLEQTVVNSAVLASTSADVRGEDKATRQPYEHGSKPFIKKLVDRANRISALRLIYSLLFLTLAITHFAFALKYLKGLLAFHDIAFALQEVVISWTIGDNSRRLALTHLGFMVAYVFLLLWNHKVFILIAREFSKTGESAEYFEDFDTEKIREHEEKVRGKPLLFRVLYRTLVAYYIEMINLGFGLLLVCEGVLSAGCPRPIPEILLETGMAFLIAAIVSIMFEVQHRENVFGKPVEKINQSVRGVEQAVARLENVVGHWQSQGAAGVAVNPVASDAFDPSEATGRKVVQEPRSLSDMVSNLQHLIGDAKILEDGQRTTLSDMVQKLNQEVTESNRISGYLNYRNQIQEVYSVAKTRVVSINDAWVTDRHWWEKGIWDECPLYQKLQNAYSELDREGHSLALKIVFAGKVAWPRTAQENNANGELEPAQKGQFLPRDFERFLGVTWRIVIAHKLREKFKLSREDTIRVVVASVPIEATVVDDDVFILLPDPNNQENIEFARGTKIAHKNPALADAYVQMLCSYLGHVRSAREYVEAVLYFGALYMTADLDTPLDARNDTIPACLQTLGLDDWEKWRNKTNYMPKDCRKFAIAIVQEFWDTNGIKARSFGDLRRDLL